VKVLVCVHICVYVMYYMNVREGGRWV